MRVGVAAERYAADVERLLLAHRQRHVHPRLAAGRGGHPLHRGDHLREQVPLVAVQLLDVGRRLVQRRVVEHLARLALAVAAHEGKPQHRAALRGEDGGQRLRGEARVPLDVELAQPVLRPLLHLHQQPRLAGLRVHHQGVADHGEVDVAVAAVELGQVRAQVLLERLAVEAAAAEPPEPFFLGPDRPLQLRVAERRVPRKVHVRQRQPVPLHHGKGQAVAARLYRRVGGVQRDQLNAARRQQVAGQLLRRRHLLRVQRLALLQPHGVAHRAPGNAAQPLEAHLGDQGALHHRQHQRAAPGIRAAHVDLHGLELSGRHQPADGVLHQRGRDHGPGAHGGRNAHGLFRHALVAADLHRVDDETLGRGLLGGGGVLGVRGRGGQGAQGESEEGRRSGPSPVEVRHAEYYTVWVFEGTRKASACLSSATETSISSPGLNSDVRIFSDSGSSRYRWIARRRGRAPNFSS